MLKNEANWFNKNLEKVRLGNSARVLNVGSGSWFFMHLRQPFIYKSVLKPLQKRGCVLINTDREMDILSSNFSKIGKFDLVLANNILEHVGSVKIAVKSLKSVVKKGGYLAVSVPYKFPYHPDPIDNGFRPDLKELTELFRGFSVVEGEIVSQNFWIMINRRTFFWFNKTFKATCVILRKN